LALRLGGLSSGLWLGLLAVFAEVDESHLVGHDFDFRFLLAGGLIFPLLLLEAALDMQAEAFGEELTAVFGGLAEYGYVDKVAFLMLLVLVVIPYPVESEADVGDGGTFGSVADFWVAGQVAQEMNGVD
jgi:hypothetical protein